MFVDDIQVYKVAPPSSPQVVYQMEDGSDPGWAMTGSDQNCYYNTEEDAMEVSWTGNSNGTGTCSVFVGSGISDGRFQTTYRFMASYGFESFFLPGLWDPTMNFNGGMAFAAGVYEKRDGYYFFVFRPCSGSNPDENNKECWESLEGVSLRAIAGHYPERNFSYVLFQEANTDRDTDRDMASYVKYGTACFNLTQFGFTAKDTPATSVGASAYGMINEVAVTEFATPDGIQYGP